DLEPRPPARGVPGGGRLARGGTHPLPQPPVRRPRALGPSPRAPPAARVRGDAHGHRGPRPRHPGCGPVRQPEGSGRAVSRIAYFDCASGASGDMLLGALWDLGLPLDSLRAELAKLPVRGYTLEAHRVHRSGLHATKVDVVVQE